MSRRRHEARRPALAGHVAFETFSVLTRLPGEARVDADTAARILDPAFPDRCWLSADQYEALIGRSAELDVVGGMVYDALVAEAARVNGCILLTRNERARRTYERRSSVRKHVFARIDGAWRQEAYLKAGNTSDDFLGDRVGAALGLSANGDALAVGAVGEHSGATAIGGNQDDDSEPQSGAVYLY